MSTVITYTALIAMLRLSGNRTLSKMNGFDFVITIAMGSMFGSGVLQKSISVTELVLGLALLVALQYLITWTAVRWPRIDTLVKSEPVLLYHEGRFLYRAMKKARVARHEVMSAARMHGYESVGQLDSVVLEPGGTFSVVPRRRAEISPASFASPLTQ